MIELPFINQDISTKNLTFDLFAPLPSSSTSLLLLKAHDHDQVQSYKVWMFDPYCTHVISRSSIYIVYTVKFYCSYRTCHSTDYISWCETSQVQFPIGVAESSHFCGSPYDPRLGALLLQNAVDATSSLKCSRLGRIEDGNRKSDGWRWRSYPPQYFIISIYIIYISSIRGPRYEKIQSQIMVYNWFLNARGIGWSNLQDIKHQQSD